MRTGGASNSFMSDFIRVAARIRHQSPTVRVAIVVSKNIRPYLEAVEGFESGLADNADIKTQVFNLEKLDDKGRVELFRGPGVKEFALFVAVGPEAALSVWKGIGREGASRIYFMVLNPEKVFGPKKKGLWNLPEYSC